MKIKGDVFMNDQEKQKIQEELEKLKETKESALKKSQEELDKIDQRRDYQTYAEGEKEVTAKLQELETIKEEIESFNKINEEIENLNIEKLKKDMEEQEEKLKKVQEEFEKLNQGKDPKLYAELQYEISRRKEDFDKATENYKDAISKEKKLKEQLKDLKGTFSKKYHIEVDKTEKNQNEREEERETELKNPQNQKLEELKRMREEKRKELNELRLNIVNNGGNISIDQRNKILDLKSEIKKIEKEIQDIENGNINIEDKHTGQPKIEDKHAGQPRIEDKHAGQLRIEDKHPIIHPEISIEKTGLQIFREQFNQMPEQKRRHSISESPAKHVFSAAGIITAAAIGGGPIGLGIAAAGVATSALYGPVLKTITGQRKLEKQIQKQFEEMDKEEFLKMARYLTEEKVITLKPHCAILNALTKASQKICPKMAAELGEESNSLKERQAELREKSNPTLEEKRELAEIGRRIEEIDGHGDILGEREKLLREPKEIKRGTKRKSAEYQGNFKGKKIMNLFVKRNHSSKEYSNFINDYADAERAHDEEIAFSKYEASLGNEGEALKRENQAHEYHDLQKNVMNRNTRVKFGVSLGPANAGEDGTTATVVSDQQDKKIRMATVYGTLGLGLAHTIVTAIDQVNALNLNADEAERIAQAYNGREEELTKFVDDLKESGHVSPEEIKQALASEIATRVNAGEQENLSTFGTVSYTNEGYVNADALVNETAEKAMKALNNEDLSKMSATELLEKLKDSINESGIAQGKTGDALNGKEFLSGVDHELNESVNRMSVEGKNVEANLIGRFADMLKKSQEFKPGETISANVVRLKNNFFGPAMTTLSAVISRAKDAKDNFKEGRDKKKQDIDAEINR